MLAAEVIPSYKFDNRRLYQKSRIGELPHFCNVSEKVQSIGDVCFCKLAAFLDNANCIV